MSAIPRPAVLVAATTAALLVAAVAPAASPPGLAFGVAGLEPDAVGSQPHGFTRAGDRVFFLATDDLHGRELWVTSGRHRGTRLVTDLCPGLCDGGIGPLAAVGDEVYFVANPSGVGADLWRSDGTRAGSRRVARTCSATSYCHPPEWMHAVGDRVLFTQGAFGEELWASDGTAAGTVRLPAEPFPRPPLVVDGIAYFGAFTLWRTDGTVAGTERVADLGHPDELTALGGEVVFTAHDDTRRRLWATDGTAAGTREIRGEAPTATRQPFELTAFGDHVWFLANAPGLGWTFRTDGVDVEPAPEIAPRGEPPHRLHAGPTHLFVVPFGANELWATSGPGDPARQVFAGFFVRSLANLDDERIVFVDQGPDGNTLWESDGTVAGTRLVRDDVSVESFDFGRLDDALVFAGQDARGVELWRTDGTPPGTRRFADLFAARRAVAPAELTRFAGSLVFAGGDGDGRGLWRIRPGEAAEPLELGVEPARLTVAGRRLFYLDSPGNTASGPVLVTNGEPGAAVPLLPGSTASELVAYRGEAFVAVDQPSRQLWASDGTAGGTRLLVEVERPFGLPSPPIVRLTPTEGPLFFVMSWSRPELWVSDGTPDGALPIGDFPGIPAGLLAVGRRVFFLAEDEDGRSLWTSDGTEAGTHPVLQEPDLPPSTLVHLLGGTGERLLFVVSGEEGDVLWVTDGTVDGTEPIAELAGRVLYRGEPALAPAVAGRDLVFAVDDPETGAEPWASDGTAKGTGPLRDLLRGPRGSFPHAFAPLSGRRVVLTAGDAPAGAEAWIGDGRRLRRLFDLAPGRDAADPAGYTQVGSCLYLTADDRTTGRELWVVDLAAPTDATPGGACL